MTDEKFILAQRQLTSAIGAALESLMGEGFGQLSAVEVAGVMACGDGTYRTVLLTAAKNPAAASALVDPNNFSKENSETGQFQVGKATQ